jgi:hypothetical protein
MHAGLDTSNFFVWTNIVGVTAPVILEFHFSARKNFAHDEPKTLTKNTHHMNERANKNDDCRPHTSAA